MSQRSANNIIRKISVGPDYKSGSMHYVVGQEVLGGSNKISRITREDVDEFLVWIENQDQEVTVWKAFIGMPVSVEFDIDF